MHNPSSHLEAAIAQPRSRSSVGTTWLCMIAINASIAGLWGCQFPASSGTSARQDENAQSVPLPTIAPTPAPSAAGTDSGSSPIAIAQRATAAAARARVAAEQAAAASKAADQASEEAARAAEEADLAAGLTPPKPAHRKKPSKRGATTVAAHNLAHTTESAATPAMPSPAPAIVSDIASSPSSPAADPSPAVSSITSSEPDLVSSANAAQVHSTQEDATQLTDTSTSTLNKLNRDQLSAQDAERYDQASRLLQSARASLAEHDYVAAHSLASKAAVLIRLLKPATVDSQ
jgi:trimeric autotransporter adhesin